MEDMIKLLLEDTDYEELKENQRKLGGELLDGIKIVADTLILKLSTEHLQDFAEPFKPITDEDIDKMEKVIHCIYMLKNIRE